MIKTISKIKNFGVFSDYVKTSDIDDFSEKNIIYGWNYSGKTTISRLFQTLESKKTNPDYPNASFSIIDAAGYSTTELNVTTCNKTVRVFNSDFIDKNLSWNGLLFNPILLLGEDTIEAEKKIEAHQVVLERCRQGYKSKKDAIEGIESFIAERKTKVAKQIKTNLSLVETFTAAHLNSILSAIMSKIDSFVLPPKDISHLLKAATSSEKDKLEIVQKLFISTKLKDIDSKARGILLATPEFSTTIEYLKNNSKVSDWVEKGLELHDNKNTCDFCGSEIDLARLIELRAHFSKDLLNHKREIENLVQLIDASTITFAEVTDARFYSQFKELVKNANFELKSAISNYNSELLKLKQALQKKGSSPFDAHQPPAVIFSSEDSIRAVLEKINALIDKNNEVTSNFGKEKANAIIALKKHYIAEFYLDEKIGHKEQKINILVAHKERYEKFGKKTKEMISALEAKISLAQKGREEINAYISNFLGNNEIQIEVVKEGENERFKLVRGNAVAKNLSEGEKTAIAFSFFLTKLREIKNFNDCIVYIDDPISSLDSNHIFQVNAIIKDAFFFKDEVNGGEWKTKCKQLFISTHNFEFFSLLKELPLKKNKTGYFLIKKTSPKASTLVNLPTSIEKYSSEYHYLFSVIYKFYNSPDKADLEILLSIPNAVRRFLELYTYAKIPSFTGMTVDQRAETLFGSEQSKRILKVLHHFSHLNNIERLANNTDLICDIENAVTEIMHHVKKDELHFNALVEGVQ